MNIRSLRWLLSLVLITGLSTLSSKVGATSGAENIVDSLSIDDQITDYHRYIAQEHYRNWMKSVLDPELENYQVILDSLNSNEIATSNKGLSYLGLPIVFLKIQNEISNNIIPGVLYMKSDGIQRLYLLDPWHQDFDPVDEYLDSMVRSLLEFRTVVIDQEWTPSLLPDDERTSENMNFEMLQMQVKLDSISKKQPHLDESKKDFVRSVLLGDFVQVPTPIIEAEKQGSQSCDLILHISGDSDKIH